MFLEIARSLFRIPLENHTRKYILNRFTMPLSTGDKLGPYEIVSPIGEGGMGEVYKARDTRLERSVAIKVLPEHIAKREDLRARFERESLAGRAGAEAGGGRRDDLA